jgi:serine/threonine protein kinase
MADLQRTDDRMFDLRAGDNIVHELYQHIEVPVNVKLKELENLQPLAKGAYCTVYSALFDGHKVAVKKVNAGGPHEAQTAADMEREFVLLNQIRHPNIVRLLGTGRDERNHRFLLLEFLPGPLLTEAIGTRAKKDYNTEGLNFLKKVRQRKGLEFYDALRHATDLASALTYLHSQAFFQHRCIHRDIKPDNISFDADGRIKLLDFGLAKLVEQLPSTRSTLFKMTGETGVARYMCPEVALHRPYNEKCDVYSFGILLWEMAAAKLPFKRMTREQFYQQVIIRGERPPLLPKWPEAFQSILTDCWAQDPDERPQFVEVYRRLNTILTQMDRLKHSDKPLWQDIFQRMATFEVTDTIDSRVDRASRASMPSSPNHVPLQEILASFAADDTEASPKHGERHQHHGRGRNRSLSF